MWWSVCRLLRREFPRPMILLWDRLPAHKSRQTRSYLQAATQQGWLRLEWLPAYAPELNPVEYLWGYLDGGVLAHYAPPTLGEIRQRVKAGARRVRRCPDVLRGFLKASSLFF
ncbi:MAG TPA: transposase [Candidatus Acidoferrales bacterium]